MPTPQFEEQIRQAQAGLINLVVQATQNPDLRRDLDPVLQQAREAGWTMLVQRIGKSSRVRATPRC